MNKLPKNFPLDNLTPDELENIKGGFQFDPCPSDGLILTNKNSVVIGTVYVPQYKTTLVASKN